MYASIVIHITCSALQKEQYGKSAQLILCKNGIGAQYSMNITKLKMLFLSVPITATKGKVKISLHLYIYYCCLLPIWK